MIELGKIYKDLVTGFAGVAVGKVGYITGCNQALIQPRCDDSGKLVDSVWFDDKRLKEVDGATKIELPQDGTPPGFDKEPPKI